MNIKGYKKFTIGENSDSLSGLADIIELGKGLIIALKGKGFEGH